MQARNGHDLRKEQSDDRQEDPAHHVQDRGHRGNANLFGGQGEDRTDRVHAASSAVSFRNTSSKLITSGRNSANPQSRDTAQRASSSRTSYPKSASTSQLRPPDRKSTRLNSSHQLISYA